MAGLGVGRLVEGTRAPVHRGRLVPKAIAEIGRQAQRVAALIWQGTVQRIGTKQHDVATTEIRGAPGSIVRHAGTAVDDPFTRVFAQAAVVGT